MLTLPRSVRIFVAIEPVDMRKGFDGLGRAVAEMGKDVYSGHLFAFVSRRGDRIKILAWDHGGFVLWYKRLEHGRFKLPARQNEAEATVTLDGPSLSMLLDGIDYTNVRRPKHWRPKRHQDDRQDDANVIQAPHVSGRLRQAGCLPAADHAGIAEGGRGAQSGPGPA